MRNLPLLSLSGLVLLASLAPSVIGCGDSSGGPPSTEREEGQTDFSSAPPAGQGGGFGRSENAGTAAPAADGKAGASTDIKLGREIQETDLYRLEGDRLYYLNSYRGLMVFDVSNVDAPKLLGRAPVFGTPVEMLVRNGVATVVIGDWYGTAPDGKPFHGSVVRSIDAADPGNMKVLGEAQVKGWARDMRVLTSDLWGDTLYIVSEDYGWSYGYWGMGSYSGGLTTGAADVASPYGYGGNSKVVISSINLANKTVTLKGTKEYDGYAGAFNVTQNAILLAHDIRDAATKNPTGKVSLEYIDISDVAGTIAPKGSIQVAGLLEGWSADNGRWNLDFDGKTASVLTCAAAEYGYCNGQNGYNLTTSDFTDANAPKPLGALAIPGKGWSATARFANARMYLSPREGYYTTGGGQSKTPVEIYDLSVPALPKLAGSTDITGAVWLFMPMGTDRLFALGNDYGPGYSSNKVSLRYFDVADATKPTLLGTSTFGDGWAWTPAAGTFKAFVRDDAQKLVVLPFSGWSNTSYEYTNGVQLIEYDTASITTRGAAKSKGWVERGIFVKGRIVSLSDQALSVVDYSDRNNPKVVSEMTLARNVVSAQPQGATIAQLSTDWWGYDQQKSELRVLDIANAEEQKDDPATKSVAIDGSDARVFRNGDLAYVVSMRYPAVKDGSVPWSATPQVQVVDLANGGAQLRGKVDLPAETSSSWYWWGGCYYWDWYDGSGVVQIGGDSLAFRRVQGTYNQITGKYSVQTKLFVVDLANADAPRLASTTITPDEDSWWGNMRVVGSTLYTTHYEWLTKPVATPTVSGKPETQYYVKYYLDQIDLSDRNAPKVGKRINVPGILVGASETDPSLLYFVDYRWYGTDTKDELAVAQIKNDKAYFRSSMPIDGWVGNVFVRGNKAYMSAQDYVSSADPNMPSQSFIRLHEVDLTDPKKPVDRASTPSEGWGWLVDVEGDRAIITSGWGQVGLDIYRLQQGAPPVFDQFARTRGWWPSAITRQGNDLFVSSGYWGVQKIALQ